jgi:adenosylmethionine-8-amino-7-oxononanoate aminotransferase
MTDHPLVGDVRHRGLIAGVELVADKASKEPFPWERQLGAEVCRRARGHGLFIRPLGDVLVIMPPLAISSEQLDEMFAIIHRSLDEVTP